MPSPKELTLQQLATIGKIRVDTLLSPARLAELNSLAEQGYTASAIIAAIREAAYAARNNIVIPPTIRDSEIQS